MALPFIFASLSSGQVSDLDVNFAAVGALTTIPCAVVGTNALTFTPLANTPAIAGYANYLRIAGVVAATNTGAATAAVAGFATLNIYKDTGGGPAVLTGGELAAGNAVQLTFDAALNAGAGGWHVEFAGTGSGGGTVTSVGSGAGLTGGPITTSGTLGLALIASQRILANITAGSAAPSANTISSILDFLGTTQGGVPSRGAAAWASNVESSWSPALSFGGGSAGITYGTQVGQFYQIGFLVFAMYNIVLTGKGSSTGSAAISLPVIAGGTNRIGGGLVVNYANMTSVTSVPWAYVAAGATTASLLGAGSGTVTNLADTNFAANSSLAGILLYLSG